MTQDQMNCSGEQRNRQAVENAVTSEQKKDRPKRFSKKSILIFLAGFLVGVFLLTGFSFSGLGDFFNGTVSAAGGSQNKSFEDQVLNAKLPVVLLVSDGGDDSLSKDFAKTFANLKKKYASQLSFVQMNFTDQKSFFNDMGITAQPSMVLYDQREAIGVITTKGEDFNNLLANRYPDLVDETLNPAVYTMFYKDETVDYPLGYENYDTVGVLRLFTGEPDAAYYQSCEGQTLSGYRYRNLAALYGTTANDQVSATLPDLRGSAPFTGIDYYMCTHYGLAPETAARSGTVVGNIKYYKHKNMSVSCLYIGEVCLVEGGESSAYSKNLLPCNGTELDIADYRDLYEKIGTTFGGDGTTTFSVPDLTGKSPIGGAQYYISYAGTPTVVE